MLEHTHHQNSKSCNVWHQEHVYAVHHSTHSHVTCTKLLPEQRVMQSGRFPAAHRSLESEACLLCCRWARWQTLVMWLPRPAAQPARQRAP